MVTMQKIKNIRILDIIVEGRNIEDVKVTCKRITDSLKHLCQKVSYNIVCQGTESETNPDKYKYYCEIECLIEIKQLNEDINDSKIEEVLKKI